MGNNPIHSVSFQLKKKRRQITTLSDWASVANNELCVPGCPFHLSLVQHPLKVVAHREWLCWFNIEPETMKRASQPGNEPSICSRTCTMRKRVEWCGKRCAFIRRTNIEQAKRPCNRAIGNPPPSLALAGFGRWPPTVAP